MSTFSYQVGYQLGVIVAKARKALRDLPTAQYNHRPRREPFMDELRSTPAMVRKGINLNDWYIRNVTVCPDTPRRKRPRPARKPKPLDSVS